MNIRADFSQKEVVRPDAASWVASPQPGVSRLMLERIGDEIARATSLVRFAPDSAFPFHVHGGGEEIFVLDGVFEDEHGIYPAGTYLRDPVGTAHTPFSTEGCLLFVKLWQFAPNDTARLVIDTPLNAWRSSVAREPAVALLHEFEGEATCLMRFPPGARIDPHVHEDAQELLILDGVFSDADGDYPKGSWLRFPQGSAHAPFSVPGAILLAKAGHLPPQKPLRLPAA